MMCFKNEFKAVYHKGENKNHFISNTSPTSSDSKHGRLFFHTKVYLASF